MTTMTSSATMTVQMMTAEQVGASVLRFAAEAAAALFDSLLTNASASAVQLDGTWYVVTSGTGEGQDYAYEVEGIADTLVPPKGVAGVGDRVEAGEGEDHDTGTVERACHGRVYIRWDGSNTANWHAADDLEIIERAPFDYSSWCNTRAPVVDRRIAIAYYLASGRHLGDGGSCILTSGEVDVLDVVRDLA